MISRQWIALCLLSFRALRLQAFAPRSSIQLHSSPFLRASGSSLLTASRIAEEKETSFLLTEFRMHTGEIIDPYKVLKLSRHADRSDIKQSYRNLSRRYHPDATRHKDILPGSCNNWDEVRDMWERIKLSYEILSDKKKRSRYDRHYMLADPGKALQQAAVDAAFSGISGVGKGIFNAGAFAFKQMAAKASEEKNNKAV
jgi:DnaJ-class molecular chaperone